MRIICLTTLLASLSLSAGCASHDGPYALEESPVSGGDTASQAEHYRKMLDADPRDVDTRLDYAAALSWQGKYRAAEQQYSALLKQQPDNLEAMTGLAYNYVWNDQYALAERQFKQALDNAPDNYCLLYTSPSPRDGLLSRMPSSA